MLRIDLITIVDTSVWINNDRAIDTPASLELLAIKDRDPASLACCDPVLMELLAGASSEFARRRIKKMLHPLQWVSVRPEADFEGAALIYNRCRASGSTVMNMMDCMIANIAIRTGARILADDNDFESIASVTDLQLHRP